MTTKRKEEGVPGSWIHVVWPARATRACPRGLPKFSPCMSRCAGLCESSRAWCLQECICFN